LANPPIATAVIEKTLLEKAFLLHELFTTIAALLMVGCTGNNNI
jgi:hypothetical protein